MNYLNYGPRSTWGPTTPYGIGSLLYGMGRGLYRFGKYASGYKPPRVRQAPGRRTMSFSKQFRYRKRTRNSIAKIPRWVERKYYLSVTNGMINVPATNNLGNANVYFLTPVTQGSGYNQRNGGMITLLNITIQMQINNGSNSPNSVRVILLRDKIPGTANPTVQNNILDSFATTANPGGDHKLAFVAPYMPQRYKTEYFPLADDKILLDEFGNGQVHYHKIFKKLNFNQKWTGTGGTISECWSNALHLIVLPTDFTVNFTWYVKFTFADA